MARTVMPRSAAQLPRWQSSQNGETLIRRLALDVAAPQMTRVRYCLALLACAFAIFGAGFCGGAIKTHGRHAAECSWPAGVPLTRHVTADAPATVRLARGTAAVLFPDCA